MNILLINPPAYKGADYIREGRCMQTKSSWATLWMPLTLANLASLLRDKGNNEVRLVDCIAENISFTGLMGICEKTKPELVILNTAIPSISGDIYASELIKKTLPNSRIAAIGMYPTLFENKMLEKYSHIDFCIIGEPEWTALKLAESLKEGNQLSDIKGLIFRQEEKVIVNEYQNYDENDVNELPFPARDLLKNEKYKLPINGEKFTLLSIGRGCPFSCIYCLSNKYYGKKFRKRSVENVIAEIEECVNIYGIKNFLFWGESFTLDQKYGEQICDEILKRNIKIIWSTASRVDTLNSVLLEKMKKAGCAMLSLGVESMSQEVLNKAKKGTTPEMSEKAVAMVKKAGIRSMGHIIFGLPGDTRESAKKSAAFACQNFDYAQFYCAVPYPKTELEEIARSNDWIMKHKISDLDLTKSIMKNETLNPKDVEKIRNSAYRSFYIRPKMLFQALRETSSLKSFLSIFNFLDWIKNRKK
jgi:anaerobic magnesium-protoporphyrin IX monomethyl ester cyclase